MSPNEPMSPEELHDYYVNRTALPVMVTPDEAPSFAGVILPLWPEAERAPGEPHERTDVWRVIWIHGTDETGLTFRSGTVNALWLTNGRKAKPAGLREMQIALPILAQPTPRGSIARVEVVLLAARCGLTVSFGYTKDDTQTIEEERRGVPLGYRSGKDGDLLVLADADRGGEKRSFKSGRITALRLVAHQKLPIWSDETGWTLPAA